MTKAKVCLLLLSLLFFACGKGGDYEQMRKQLMKAKTQNENYESFSSDSMMLRMADYFDRNGTANEKIMAHYLLGSYIATLVTCLVHLNAIIRQ